MTCKLHLPTPASRELAWLDRARRAFLDTRTPAVTWRGSFHA